MSFPSIWAKEPGELAGTGPGGHDALAVVAQLGPEQVQVAFRLVLVHLGQQFGLRSARGGTRRGLALGRVSSA